MAMVVADILSTPWHAAQAAACVAMHCIMQHPPSKGLCRDRRLGALQQVATNEEFEHAISSQLHSSMNECMPF